MMTFDTWKRLSKRQCAYHDLLVSRIPAIADLPAADAAVVELGRRFERHTARMARHNERALRSIEPIGSVQ
jgi:hypothetical protein